MTGGHCPPAAFLFKSPGDEQHPGEASRRERHRPDRARASSLSSSSGSLVNFVKAPTEFINIGLIGLTNGTIYGLVALGYTLVYGILQLINFAHGDVFALSGLVASTVIVSVLGLDEDSSVLAIIGGLVDHARRDHDRVLALQRLDRAGCLQAAAAARHGWRR